jgi:hypothetical protein
MADIYADSERILARLEQLGDGAAAERLRIAMAGSTSGEILDALSGEFETLLRTPLRDDDEVGALLREASAAADRVTHPRLGRRLSRMWLRRGSP